MATDIGAYAEIDKLQQLNGVPIAEIERRARPGNYATSGFLGPTESLKEVLTADWQTVRNLGTTHVEFADQIAAIWNQEKHLPFGIILHTSTSPRPLLERAPFRFIILISLVSSVAAVIFANPVAWWGLSLAVPCVALALCKKQILLISNRAYKGMQDDIFDKKKGWNTEIDIRNLLNFKKVTVADGVVDYIRKYGFYEGGGKQNPYRVDPSQLAAILC